MEFNLKVLFAEKGVEKQEEIIEAMVKDLKYKDSDIIEIYSYYLPFFFNSNSPFTMKNKYDEVRKAINESSIAKKRKVEILKVFRPAPNTYFYMNKLQDINIVEKLNNKKEFTLDSYLENMQYVKKLIEDKDFDSIRINRQEDDYLLANLSAVYFALATGRRSFEIFKTIEISKIGKTVYYKGIAKKRDDEEIDLAAYPLDEDYHFLKKCLENVRKYYKVDEFDNKRFNQTYQNAWNKFVKNLLKDENISYSTIRDMYSDVAIKKLNSNNIDEEKFRKIVLSHQDTMMSTTDYYRKTKLVD